MIHFRPRNSESAAVGASARVCRSDQMSRLLSRVRSGELLLTGYCYPITLASQREVVPANLLDVLEIDFDRLEASAPGLMVVGLKLSEGPSANASIARNEATVNDRGPVFVCNAGYSRVVLRGLIFNLSGGLCQIVQRLHSATQSGDPWMVGKQLLGQCGYTTNLMGDAFKRHREPSWHNLIIGNGRGLYRLNL